MELITTAKPYANAVFEIAKEDKTQANWKNILIIGAQLANDTTIKTFIASPSVQKSKKANTIINLYNSILDKDLNKKESTFIRLLLTNKRFDLLPNILHLFIDATKKTSKIRTFHVISAFELNTKEKNKIIKDLTTKHNTSINIETKVNKDLIGGVIIKEDDKVIDASVRARANALNLCLSTTNSF